MGFILLVMAGALLGWLGSIITRTEDLRGIARYAGAGTAGALVAGIAVNRGSVLVGLTALALFAAVLGAISALAAYRLVQRRQAGG